MKYVTMCRMLFLIYRITNKYNTQVILCLKVTCNKMKQFRSLGGVAICIGCICKCCKSGTYWPYLPIYWNSFRKITLKGYHATWRANVILLQLTDNPNAPDNFGVTPIHMAPRIGHAEIAKPWPLSSILWLSKICWV